MRSPDISIIVACFNKVTMISETINSVLNQTFTNWELVIIDDHSNDGSSQLVKDNYNDQRIIILENETNRGANYCRNKGLSLAKGNYVMFLDADDLLKETCLQARFSEAMHKPESNLFVFTMGVFHTKIGDDSRLWLPQSSSPLKDFLMHRLPWSIIQPLWKKEFVLNLGGFDEKFDRLQDVELNTRALLNKDLKLEIIGGDADCFYRISESRKNYKAVELLTKWVDSANRYYQKFSKLVSKELKKYLLATLYQTYLQVIYNYKKKNITKTEYKKLEQELFTPETWNEITYFKRSMFVIGGFINTHLMRIPGVNFLIQKLIVL